MPCPSIKPAGLFRNDSHRNCTITLEAVIVNHSSESYDSPTFAPRTIVIRNHIDDGRGRWRSNCVTIRKEFQRFRLKLVVWHGTTLWSNAVKCEQSLCCQFWSKSLPSVDVNIAPFSFKFFPNFSNYDAFCGNDIQLLFNCKQATWCNDVAISYRKFRHSRLRSMCLPLARMSSFSFEMFATGISHFVQFAVIIGVVVAENFNQFSNCVLCGGEIRSTWKSLSVEITCSIRSFH